MAFITHCQSRRRALRYWLNGDSDEHKWTTVLLLESCPNCKQAVLEYQHVDWRNRKGPQHRVKQAEIPDWLERIASELVCDEAGQDAAKKKKDSASPQISKGVYLVSEATREMSRNTASVFDYILRRLKLGRYKTRLGETYRSEGK